MGCSGSSELSVKPNEPVIKPAQNEIDNNQTNKSPETSQEPEKPLKEDKGIIEKPVLLPTKPMSTAKEIFEYQNIARQHPECIVDKLKELTQDPIQKHSSNTLKEVIYDMSVKKPLEPLEWSEELYLACKDHIENLRPKEMINDRGSNGSTIYERANKYGEFKKICGENIQFGGYEAKEIILSLIIDAKSSIKTHRRTLMEPKFTKGAVCSGPHAKYGVWTVFAYSE